MPYTSTYEDLVTIKLTERFHDLKKSLEVLDEFPEGNPWKISDELPNDNFDRFLKKVDILLSLQLFFSLNVIQKEKQVHFQGFTKMYFKTQQEMISLAYDMFYRLNRNGQNLVLDYLDIDRLGEEIDNTMQVVYEKWNVNEQHNVEEQELSDKELLGIVEQVGDSVKEPMKKVFGGIGNKLNRYVLRRKGEDEKEPWSIRNQSRIGSAIKYFDEFANIGMRMARGGL